MKDANYTEKGAGFAPRYQNTETALPPARGIQQGTGPHAGRKGNKPERKKNSPAGNAADGFLKHSFIPLYLEKGSSVNSEETGEGILQSLSLLADCFQLRLMDVSACHFPYNVLLAHWDAQKQLRKTRQSPELFIVEDDSKRSAMATCQTASRTYSLYYIGDYDE